MPALQTYSLFGRKNLDIETRQLELPALTENDVLVKVHACGVCGTDLNYVRDWNGAHQPMGHEIAAEVLETGKKVLSVQPGDKIIVEDCTMCGRCTDCKSGHPEFCRSMYTLNGFSGMSEYMVVNEANVVKFEGMDYVSACLTEPLAVAYNAVLTADIPLGGSVMIFGPGPIGLLIAALAKMRGAGFVGITSLTAKSVMENARITLAGKIGCDIIIHTDTQDINTEARKLFPNGVDRVIVTSPPKSMNEAFRIIRYGGIITFLGLSFKDGHNIIEFDVNHAIFNKITLRPFFAEPAINFHASAQLIKSGSIQSCLFQTHFCNFANVKEILGNVLEGSIPVIKPVFLPWQ